MKQVIAVAAIMFSLSVNANTQISLDGPACSNGSSVTSIIQVNRATIDNQFEIEVYGGLPSLTTEGEFICIEKTAYLGHIHNPTEVTVSNRVVNPTAAESAKGVAWYDAGNNVVVLVPAVVYAQGNTFNGDVSTSSTLAPISTMLVFKIIEDGSFQLIELVVAASAVASIAAPSAGLYRDLMVDENFFFTKVNGINYKTAY